MDKIGKMIKDVSCFLLDMDGTVYIGDGLIGDMRNTLIRIRDSGRKIVYLTNNSSKNASTYRDKLKRLGVLDERDDVYTSGMATAEHIAMNHKGQKVYLVGTDDLKEDFLKNGIQLVEEAPDIAVLGYDTKITYDKLVKLTRFVTKGAYYIATHPDVNCPAPDVFVPDTGSFMKLVEASTGRLPDVICGKPFGAMGAGLQRRYSLKASEFLMAGDRLNTDIKFALNNGFVSVLVLSGETTKEVYSKQDLRADLLLGSLNEIVKYI